jgi:hypothetical protein
MHCPKEDNLEPISAIENHHHNMSQVEQNSQSDGNEESVSN